MEKPHRRQGAGLVEGTPVGAATIQNAVIARSVATKQSRRGRMGIGNEVCFVPYKSKIAVFPAVDVVTTARNLLKYPGGIGSMSLVYG